MEHDLKCWPHAFDAVRAGTKTFEVRSNRDRDFAVGDVLLLRRWCPKARAYYAASPSEWGNGWSSQPGLADTERVRVTYVLHGGRFDLPAGVCVMAIVREPQETKP